MSFAISFYLVSPFSLRSFCTASYHLLCGLLLLFFPFGFFHLILLTRLSFDNLSRWPNHCYLRAFTTWIIYLILYIICKFPDLYMYDIHHLLSSPQSFLFPISLSQTSIFSCANFVIAKVSHPYSWPYYGFINT